MSDVWDELDQLQEKTTPRILWCGENFLRIYARHIGKPFNPNKNPLITCYPDGGYMLYSEIIEGDRTDLV